MKITKFRAQALATTVFVASSAGLLGCTPAAPASSGIACEGGTAQFELSPGLATVDRPTSMMLTVPTTRLGCVDATGGGIDGASLDDASVSFESLSCFIDAGTTGRGSGRIHWSDGSTSNAAISVRLDGGATGTLMLHVTEGHFAGSTGTAPIVVSPTGGSCFGEGLTSLAVTFGRIELVQS